MGEGGYLVGGGGDVGHGVGHGVGVATGIGTVTHADARSTTVVAGGTVVGVSLGRAVGVGVATGASSPRDTKTTITTIRRTAAAARTTGDGPPRLFRALEMRKPGSSSFTGIPYLNFIGARS